MRAITIEEPKRLRLIEIDDARPPGPGEALVRTHRMGVCGTDVSSYLGTFPFFEYPRIPGHELGVEVLEVGAGVSNVRPGDRCSVEPYMNCGRCFACRRGQTNCCERLSVIGVMEDGGLCERFTVRADKLHPSTFLTYEQLALVETLAIGRHATTRGAAASGEHVLIIGAGPIGLATLEFTRLAGAAVTVMDIAPERLQFCRSRYGVEHVILSDPDADIVGAMREITCGDMFSVVTDATGNNASMANALRYVAHSGTLVYVGVTRSEICFPHPAMHRPEMTIRSSRNALPGDFVEIIRLIEEGQIDSDPWITHRIGFARFCQEMDALIQPGSNMLKAIVEVS